MALYNSAILRNVTDIIVFISQMGSWVVGRVELSTKHVISKTLWDDISKSFRDMHQNSFGEGDFICNRQRSFLWSSPCFTFIIYRRAEWVGLSLIYPSVEDFPKGNLSLVDLHLVGAWRSAVAALDAVFVVMPSAAALTPTPFPLLWIPVGSIHSNWLQCSPVKSLLKTFSLIK